MSSCLNVLKHAMKTSTTLQRTKATKRTARNFGGSDELIVIAHPCKCGWSYT